MQVEVKGELEPTLNPSPVRILTIATLRIPTFLPQFESQPSSNPNFPPTVRIPAQFESQPSSNPSPVRIPTFLPQFESLPTSNPSTLRIPFKPSSNPNCHHTSNPNFPSTSNPHLSNSFFQQHLHLNNIQN